MALVGDFTRESLVIEVGQRLTGDRVAEVLDRVGRQRGRLPEKIRVDNSTEFTSKRLDQWAYGWTSAGGPRRCPARDK